ncbi:MULTISPECIES: hypothetical protein [unclassified Neptuniibacter]|uniref:hypothetical protein n=1 Tax=unclassified Neptuniibacter TaxID=2630693 RepID=UPI000C4BB29B|nr:MULTISPECIES: hypothetical protein [unclassified Neptuniibacter]MAY42388.1 hypothetical protein [Oceanospirillaceae bacterium]|tara:strand:- start:13264 stop:13632 length:369 start_codon:yes stop_codon:yes gene_type:complete
MSRKLIKEDLDTFFDADDFGELVGMKPAGELIEVVALITRDVEVLTLGGDVQDVVTYIKIPRVEGVVPGNEIWTVDERWRIVKPVSDDGLLVNYLVTPLVSEDHEMIEQVNDSFHRVVHEDI